MASSLGFDITFEPRPGDLLIRDGDTAVTVEVFSMRIRLSLINSRSWRTRCTRISYQ